MLLRDFPTGVDLPESGEWVSGETDIERPGEDGRFDADIAATIEAVEEHRRGLEATIQEQREVVADLSRSQERLSAAADREDSQAKRAVELLSLEYAAELDTLRRLEDIHGSLLEETAALSLL